MEEQILLYYGFQEHESGIYHAFEAVDPNDPDNEELGEALATSLDTNIDDPNFNYDMMYINLPDSLVARIKADGVREFKEDLQARVFKRMSALGSK